MLCDIGGELDDAELAHLEDLVINLARVGFTGIIVRPSHSDLALGDSALEHFITRVHRAGLSAVVRLSGAGVDPTGARAFTGLEDGTSALVVRTRAALKAGADGIDLGLIDEGPPPRSKADRRRTTEAARRFSRLVRLEHAELADFDSGPILTAEAHAYDEAALTRHLEEDWFHHLLDDALITASWDARTLHDRVRFALERRDPLGQVAVWQWADTRHAGLDEDIPTGSWADGAPRARRRAMALFVLSLPGAVHVPFGALGGHLDRDAPPEHRRTWGPDSTTRSGVRLLAEALRIRVERSIGSGSLGFVNALEWAHEGVAVHICSGVLVVLNTSDEAVIVPEQHRLMVSSGQAEAQDGQPTVVRPETCAWFETAIVRPREEHFHD